MRFVPKAALATLWLLGMAFFVAPAARAASSNRPSSDAPWFIGVLVLALVGVGMLFLLLKRRTSRGSRSSGST